MNFKLSIELGNSDMLTGEDIAQALHKVADHIDDPSQYFDDPTDESGFDKHGTIRDINGNTVGSWAVYP